jgi:hypothetical protein
VGADASVKGTRPRWESVVSPRQATAGALQFMARFGRSMFRAFRIPLVAIFIVSTNAVFYLSY